MDCELKDISLFFKQKYSAEYFIHNMKHLGFIVSNDTYINCNNSHVLNINDSDNVT